MSSLLILACLGGLALVALIVYATGKAVGGDWDGDESSVAAKDLLALNPISAAGNLIRIARESDGLEVRQTAVGFQPLKDGRPDESFTPYIPTPDGTPTWSRVIREGKKGKRK